MDYVTIWQRFILGDVVFPSCTRGLRGRLRASNTMSNTAR